MNAIGVLVAGAIAMSGCASISGAGRSSGGAVGQIIRDSNSPGGTTADGFTPNRPMGSAYWTVNQEVQGRELKVNTFDYPVVVNPSVEKWLTYFQGKGRKFFEKYLERGRYFIPEIAKALKANRMPQDLVYLAMIESGFHNSAKSRARAVGPWQFIRSTGKRYGLKVDYWIDERRDTRRSTMAAIDYLRELYQEFGSWELAAAGYNAGEGKVRRAVRKYKTTNFWEIARRRFLRPETRDYVPKIMAAAILTKNPELFGFENPFRKGKTIVNPTVLMVVDSDDSGAGSSEDEAELTPKELGEPVAGKEDTAEDPEEKPSGDLAVADEEDAPEEDAGKGDAAMVSNTPMPTMSPSVYMVANPNEQIIEFEVKGPTDLFAVAKASGLPYSTIKVLNPELLRWCTPPYLNTYRIKLPSSIKSRFLATYNDDSFDRRVVFMKYKVRQGDSIRRVARRFGVEADPIREINQVSPRSDYLRVGSSIFLPVPNGYKRVIASMYDDKPFPAAKRRRYRKRSKRKAPTSNVMRHERLPAKFQRG